MNLYPTECNICGGPVIYTSNSHIYGREYGSGKCYLCTRCGAYVGTHIPRPREAYGLLADEQMRDMKKKCHALFDRKWLNKKQKQQARQKAYAEMAKILDIPITECHFGYFNLNMLNRAYRWLKETETER